ncbi:MAG TPA: thiamine-monophosphate kinase, partial [Candidatus Binatia bacterium]|nr:thiamine-monophosphate kinase [Candidatus Binatia bacterium]
AELLSDAIPISPAARSAARAGSSARLPLLAALSDGEDFELLLTVAAGDAVPLLDAWKKQFPELRLSCIGKVSAEPGLSIRDKKGVQPLAVHGYVHFQKSC